MALAFYQKPTFTTLLPIPAPCLPRFFYTPSPPCLPCSTLLFLSVTHHTSPLLARLFPPQTHLFTPIHSALLHPSFYLNIPAPFIPLSHLYPTLHAPPARFKGGNFRPAPALGTQFRGNPPVSLSSDLT